MIDILEQIRMNNKFHSHIDKNSTIIDTLVIYRSFRICILLTSSMFMWLYFDLDHGYWIPMTIIIIYMPFDPGAVSKRLFDRLLGTILGLLLGFLVAQVCMFIPYFFILIPLVLLIIMYTTTNNYFHSVVIISMSISILFMMMNNNGESSIQILIERFAYTLLSCLIIFIAEYAFKPRKMIVLKLQNTMLSMMGAYCTHI